MNPFAWYIHFIGRLAKSVSRTDNKLFFRDTCSHMSGVILNLGCGRSKFSSYLKNSTEIRVDIAPNEGVMVVCDAHALPFRDGIFAGVIMEEVLEHCQNPMIVAHEIARITSNEGILALSVPFMFPMHDVPYDYFRFTRYGLETLFSVEFSIEKIELRLPGLEMFALLGVRILHERTPVKVLAILTIPASWILWKFVLRPLRFLNRGSFFAGGFLLSAIRKSRKLTLLS